MDASYLMSRFLPEHQGQDRTVAPVLMVTTGSPIEGYPVYMSDTRDIGASRLITGAFCFVTLVYDHSGLLILCRGLLMPEDLRYVSDASSIARGRLSSTLGLQLGTGALSNAN